MEQLHAFERDLRQLKVPYEEWEVLFRAKLQLERSLLQAVAGLTERPRDAADAYAGRTAA